MDVYKRKTEPDIRCPLEYGMEVFGDKWKSRILCVLFAQNVLRYSELRAEMVDVTDSVLAASLKELQRDPYSYICVKLSLYSSSERFFPVFRQAGKVVSLFYGKIVVA